MKYTYFWGKFLLILICLTLVWWFLPTRFLWAVPPQKVASIQVVNQQQDTAFAITDARDIRYIMTQIRKTSFQKTMQTKPENSTGYQLTFRKANGKTAARFTIDTQDWIQRGFLHYRCRDESALIGKYLETVEALLRTD